MAITAMSEPDRFNLKITETSEIIHLTRRKNLFKKHNIKVKNNIKVFTTQRILKNEVYLSVNLLKHIC